MITWKQSSVAVSISFFHGASPPLLHPAGIPTTGGWQAPCHVSPAAAAMGGSGGSPATAPTAQAHSFHTHKTHSLFPSSSPPLLHPAGIPTAGGWQAPCHMSPAAAAMGGSGGSPATAPTAQAHSFHTQKHTACFLPPLPLFDMDDISPSFSLSLFLSFSFSSFSN